MDLKAINRIITFTLTLSLIAAVCVCWFVDFYYAAGLAAGAVWACINLHFLRMLVQNWLITGPRDYLVINFLLWVKFPILYAGGFLLLKYHIVPAIGLLLGFSLIFLAILMVGAVNLYRTYERA
jgi:hypothetical protein